MESEKTFFKVVCRHASSESLLRYFNWEIPVVFSNSNLLSQYSLKGQRFSTKVQNQTEGDI